MSLAWEVAASVPDPELPMLTLADLGILRDAVTDGDTVTVTVTPTYSGCPAMREISADLTRRLHDAGWTHVEVRTALAPPWSSDWITEAGRAKLAAAGIAPPSPAPTGPVPLTLGRGRAARCPRCRSTDTRLTAAFAGTACTALHRCAQCGEPFQAVKAI